MSDGEGRLGAGAGARDDEGRLGAGAGASDGGGPRRRRRALRRAGWYGRPRRDEDQVREGPLRRRVEAEERAGASPAGAAVTQELGAGGCLGSLLLAAAMVFLAPLASLVALAVTWKGTRYPRRWKWFFTVFWAAAAVLTAVLLTEPPVYVLAGLVLAAIYLWSYVFQVNYPKGGAAPAPSPAPAAAAAPAPQAPAPPPAAPSGPPLPQVTLDQATMARLLEVESAQTARERRLLLAREFYRVASDALAHDPLNPASWPAPVQASALRQQAELLLASAADPEAGALPEGEAGPDPLPAAQVTDAIRSLLAYTTLLAEAAWGRDRSPERGRVLVREHTQLRGVQEEIARLLEQA
ncbi:MAG TPA: hypothetical protein VIO14_05430 [Dehalococcoidia bacterium]